MALPQEEVASLQEKIKYDSYKEREIHWQGIPFNEAMNKWEDHMNAMLLPYKTDPSKRGKLLFLQKILRLNDQQPLDSVEVSAKALYNTFFTGEGKGDVELFVEKIMDSNSIEEITYNWQFIGRLAKLYGANSSKFTG